MYCKNNCKLEYFVWNKQEFKMILRIESLLLLLLAGQNHLAKLKNVQNHTKKNYHANTVCLLIHKQGNQLHHNFSLLFANFDPLQIFQSWCVKCSHFKLIIHSIICLIRKLVGWGRDQGTIYTDYLVYGCNNTCTLG